MSKSNPQHGKHAKGNNPAQEGAAPSDARETQALPNLDAPTEAFYPVEPARPLYDMAAFEGASAEPQRKSSAGKVVAVIIAVIVAVYLVGVGFFSHWYYPNTKVGTVDASLLATGQLADQLESSVSDYSLTVTGMGFSYTANSSDAGLKLDGQAVAKSVHAALPAWQWPYLLAQSLQGGERRVGARVVEL